MREVTKDEFKKVYFKLGGGRASGWGPDYWDQFFEPDERTGMKYMVQDPETPEHDRMVIVTDTGAKEYRLFFLTDEGEDAFMRFPEYD